MSDQWRNQAACAVDFDDDDFFPLQGQTARVRRAKAVCATCPVQPECLQHALDTDEVNGVWGGLTARERFRLQRAAS